MTVYNFSAGPAILPKSVLKKAQEELNPFKEEINKDLNINI